jgi:hypothetical protein
MGIIHKTGQHKLSNSMRFCETTRIVPQHRKSIIELMRAGFSRSHQFWNTKCARSFLIFGSNFDAIAELKHRKQESARLGLLPEIHRGRTDSWSLSRLRL